MTFFEGFKHTMTDHILNQTNKLPSFNVSRRNLKIALARSSLLMPGTAIEVSCASKTLFLCNCSSNACL